MPLTFETETSQDLAERRWTFVGALCFIIVLGTFIVLVSIYWNSRSPNLSTQLVLGIIATSAVLILASTYFYAYRFFLDVFYFLISAGWFANAFYLPFEFFIAPQAKDFQFEVNLYYAGFVLNLPFYLSLFVPSTGKWDFMRFARVTAISVVSLVLGSLLVRYISTAGFPDLNQTWKFALITLPGVVFVIFLYVEIGRTIAARFEREIHGNSAILLAATFYGYAAVQVVYPFKLYLRSSTQAEIILLAVFGLALILKVANNLSLIGVLLSTVTYPIYIAEKQRRKESEERLEHRSHLEELGALASAIEHDMKSPIGEMSLTINMMRRRFQSQQAVIDHLDKLDTAKKRMASIARIIPYLRGDKAFYDRDRFMEKVNVIESIHRAVRTVKSEFHLESHNILIKVEGKDSFVRAYPPMLEQVIINVIKNSIEAVIETKRNRGLIRITVAGVRAEQIKDDRKYDKKYDKWVKIEVHDNGCGIPQENIAKVTTLFTTRGEDKANSGIGMFIGYRIMKVHNGVIDIRSTLGEETTVSLVLPEWDAYLKAAAIEEIDDSENAEDETGEPQTGDALLLPADGKAN
jgi:signal transduction histidine kinase